MKKHFISRITLTSTLIFFSILGGEETDTTSTRAGALPFLVTIHAEDAYLPGILTVLAKESGYNIVTDPSVNTQDKISIHLDEVPIEEAINLVVRAVGLGYYTPHNRIEICRCTGSKGTPE